METPSFSRCLLQSLAPSVRKFLLISNPSVPHWKSSWEITAPLCLDHAQPPAGHRQPLLEPLPALGISPTASLHSMATG